LPYREERAGLAGGTYGRPELETEAEVNKYIQQQQQQHVPAQFRIHCSAEDQARKYDIAYQQQSKGHQGEVEVKKYVHQKAGGHPDELEVKKYIYHNKDANRENPSPTADQTFTSAGCDAPLVGHPQCDVPTNHRPDFRGSTNHGGPASHGSTNHGPANHGSTNHGPDLAFINQPAGAAHPELVALSSERSTAVPPQLYPDGLLSHGSGSGHLSTGHHNPGRPLDWVAAYAHNDYALRCHTDYLTRT
jgi:hypothetical protein